ncbi:MAG: hypothetical protein ACRD25_13490 [Terracidiphilus sp.]
MRDVLTVILFDGMKPGRAILHDRARHVELLSRRLRLEAPAAHVTSA